MHKTRRTVDMLDLILGYNCNSNCIFCTATADLRSINMTTEQALAALENGVKAYAPKKVRFGGGEPTIRRDLPALVKYAAALGTKTISVQTNGYMLSYADYLKRLADNGLNRVNISLRTDDRDICERLTTIPGSHAWSMTAVENVLRAKLPLELDILLVKPVLAGLPALTARFLDSGVETINYWYVSLEGKALMNADLLVPTMPEAAAAIGGIFERHPGRSLRAFYIPYCFLRGYVENVWHPVSENTLVITPGDEFFLEKGRIDIGVKTAKCRGCRLYNRCFGVRGNYLARYGDSEIIRIR
jgi:MoaA/NifB/PqqE/SkfB family radical SAM enzyme